MSIIELNNVGKIYKTKNQPDVVALDSVNLSVIEGGFLSICGVSGSGKTTLLNLIACLDKPSSGDVIIAGNNTVKMNQTQLAHMRNRIVSMVLQEFGLISSRTVYENILVPFYFSKERLSKKDIDGRILIAMEKTGITDLKDRVVSKLSGGQRQRVAIARAIVNDTQIILADEPTGQLDSKTKREIADLFIELNQNGKTIIMVTHDNEIAQIASQIVYIKDGKLFQ